MPLVRATNDLAPAETNQSKVTWYTGPVTASIATTCDVSVPGASPSVVPAKVSVPASTRCLSNVTRTGALAVDAFVAATAAAASNPAIKTKSFFMVPPEVVWVGWVSGLHGPVARDPTVLLVGRRTSRRLRRPVRNAAPHVAPPAAARPATEPR